ncbi:SDR family oxidoreductase [Aliifodinibius sp. S!AR15-10]|uniref:NAD-dependent epimerase/dehydratase family protein n=1 Tax=Aliifodinibius sp. S!AR15-10 TaxID=2950437 RepID=UPI002864BD5E|nr:SDR family oxidoreductase [Aliifodinibius sp. S!AR15-10]MDR8390232.1 SDR family oxidoreductase [Aliifodinibius sp. S!AR15-10]
MKVLVTGTDGYIGSILGPYLISNGHNVTGLDTGFYRSGWLYNERGNIYPSYINKDLRDIQVEDLKGFDAVVHMAELSNDPLGQVNPEITFKINHKGSVRIANLCKQAGIERFVYTSSCSVYGVGNDNFKTEESELNPQTAYAECKTLVERDVSKLADDDFSPTYLRNATAYGASPRMRFDIVLNNLSGLAWTTGVIKMISDGQPWRPLVHVQDICKAINCALNAPREIVHNQVFNVGDTKENYRVKEIAEIVGQVFTGCEVTFGDSGGDNRSYRVSFDKINETLPGFSCEYDARKGAEELYEVFSRIEMEPEIFNHRSYTRLKQLKFLLNTKQVDDELFWVASKQLA